MSMSTLPTFKLVLKSPTAKGGEPEIRRLALKEDEVNLSSLRERTNALYQLENLKNSNWCFKVVDDEGDLITMTEEYEFQEFLETVSHQGTSGVCRLHIHVEPPEEGTRKLAHRHHHHHHRRQHEAMEAMNCSDDHGRVIETAPVKDKRETKRDKSTSRDKKEKKDSKGSGKKKDSLLQDKKKKKDSKIPVNDDKKISKKKKSPTKTKTTDKSGKYSAVCSMTQASLSIDQGNWWHKQGTDLCTEEFEKLSDEAKKEFVKVTNSKDLGKTKREYKHKREAGNDVMQVDTDSSANKSKKSDTKKSKEKADKKKKIDKVNKEEKATNPAATTSTDEGKKKKKTTASVKTSDKKDKKSAKSKKDLNGQKLSFKLSSFLPSFSNPESIVHMGRCSVTGAHLFMGKGWYHKQNENYDLCESEFNKLDESEKPKFVCVQRAEDLGTQQAEYNTLQRLKGVVGQFFKDLTTSEDQNGASSSTLVESTVNASDVSSTAMDIHQPSPSNPSTSFAMRVLHESVISEPVPAGARLKPVWEVENPSGAQWQDVRVRPKQGGDSRLVMDAEAFEIPDLASGERGMVSVECDVIPIAVLQEGVATLEEAVFEVVDANGVPFGEPLKVKFQIAPAVQQLPANPALIPVENEANLVELLCDMGFKERGQAVLQQVLRQHNGDVNSAALALLRLERATN